MHGAAIKTIGAQFCFEAKDVMAASPRPDKSPIRHKILQNF
jgi:hypothetical protein